MESQKQTGEALPKSEITQPDHSDMRAKEQAEHASTEISRPQEPLESVHEINATETQKQIEVLPKAESTESEHADTQAKEQERASTELSPQEPTVESVVESQKQTEEQKGESDRSDMRAKEQEVSRPLPESAHQSNDVVESQKQIPVGDEEPPKGKIIESGNSGREQERVSTEISKPQEPQAESAKVVPAAKQTSDPSSWFSFSLIISLLQYIPLPNLVRKKLKTAMSWISSHYRLSLMLVGLVVTAIFLCLPDTFLPPPDIPESAKIAKSLYCNQSVVNDLILEHIKSWKSPINSKACESDSVACDDSEIGTGVGQELPAINIRYLTALAHYACTLPKNEIQLIWGASGCGLETGLQHMIRMWKEQGRVVINVDVSSFEEKGDRIIHEATVNGFREHKLSGAAIQALEELLRNGTPSALYDGDNYMILLKKLALKTLSILPFVTEQQLAVLWDRKLAALESFVQSLITGKEGAFSEINFQSFLSAINIIASYQPSLAPIVVFNQLDAVSFMGRSERQTFIDNFLKTLEEHEQLDNILPVIISSSNTLWFRKTNILGLQSQFITYEVAEIGKEDARNVLTEKLQIWTETELNQIWNALGGYHKSLEEVYEYHKIIGHSIEDAITRVNEFTYTALTTSLSQLNTTDQDVQDREEMSTTDILNDLAQDNQLVVEDTEDIVPAIKFLLRTGVLYVDTDLKLHPISKSMQHAIRRYIQTLQTSE